MIGPSVEFTTKNRAFEKSCQVMRGESVQNLTVSLGASVDHDVSERRKSTSNMQGMLLYLIAWNIRAEELAISPFWTPDILNYPNNAKMCSKWKSFDFFSEKLIDSDALAKTACQNLFSFSRFCISWDPGMPKNFWSNFLPICNLHISFRNNAMRFFSGFFPVTIKVWH